MRSALILCLLLSFVLISSCSEEAQTDKNRRFVKQSDVERVGLKGKVKSIITYKYSFVDSLERCTYVDRVKFNAEGFLVEEIDTVPGSYYATYKGFYNKDGLLTKSMYAVNEPFHPSVDTYIYSFSEGKKTRISHNPDSSSGTADTVVYLYDQNGNEIEYKSRYTKRVEKYDEHGFLVKTYYPDAKPWEVSYENDDKGRILKQSWSDGRGTQTHVYNKEGNEIGGAGFDSLGRKTGEAFTGYCEFDEKGNYLKSITVSPQSKDMSVTRRVIEYY